jgi:hypothetical protein
MIASFYAEPALKWRGAEQRGDMQSAYAAVGVEELMLQWLDLDDIDRLREFARQLLPRV